MFGLSLVEHLRISKRDIAAVLETCCNGLRKEWMDTEGLFRIAGGQSKVKFLKVRESRTFFFGRVGGLQACWKWYYWSLHCLCYTEKVNLTSIFVSRYIHTVAKINFHVWKLIQSALQR